MKLGWRFGPLGEPDRDDWKAARPAAIARSLERALALPSGGWYVLDASRRIGRRPREFRVAGERVVAWRDSSGLHVAPEACPHMGASLIGARRCGADLVCPWHGLRLGPEGHGRWRRFASHDDGVLAWMRRDDGVEATERPILPPRPRRFLSGVIAMDARCEARDVLANRLDPWHGSHFHPYSFAALEVLSDDADGLRVVVEKRVLGRVRVAVEARFTCPDPRTIEMTILRGEGAGSVVETHATPMAPGRTRIVEATLATSPRAGFRWLLPAGALLRPLIERSARRLWVDDAAYAERLHQLRCENPPSSDHEDAFIPKAEPSHRSSRSFLDRDGAAEAPHPSPHGERR